MVSQVPFIHFRQNTKDRSLGVGRDITYRIVSYACILRCARHADNDDNNCKTVLREFAKEGTR